MAMYLQLGRVNPFSLFLPLMSLKLFRSLNLLLLLFVSLVGSAQVKLAVYAGPQATSARYTIREIKQPTDFRLGAMAGVALKVPFDGNLYFFPSVYYSLKGYKVTFNQRAFPPTQLAVNNSTRVHTIEIAPLFQVDLSTRPSHAFFRIGPSVDFALAGRETFDTV